MYYVNTKRLWRNITLIHYLCTTPKWLYIYNGRKFFSNGLFTLPESDSDSDSDSDSCTMQKFHIGSDPDSDPLIEMYGIGTVPGTDICP